MSRDDSNIRFEIPKEEKYPEVLTALHQYFIQHEPGLSARGGYPDGLPKDIAAKYAGFLLDDVSVIALDGDLIVGVMVSCIENREHDCKKPSFQDLKSEMNEKHAMINVVCNDSIHSSDFFQNHPECNRYLDLFAVGVHEKYQRRGIASKLVEKSIEAGISKNCDSAIIIATNPNTNGIAQKFKMSPYKTVLWNDYQDEQGEKWFPPEKMPDPCVNSYYKILMKKT